jgi:hypothetical protein
LFLAASLSSVASAQTTWGRWDAPSFSAYGSAGDVDNDGVTDVFTCTGPLLTVYSGATGLAIRQITAPAAPTGNYAIRDVATGVDFDSDGYDDIAFGWPGDAYAGPQSGAVWVYSGRTSQPLLVMYGPTPVSHLGSSIVTVDDLDGDGVPEIAAGAPGAYVGTGRVRVYSGRTGALLLERSGPANITGYGRRLGVLDDLDGDGRRELVIRTAFQHHQATYLEIVSLATNASVLSLAAADVDVIESCGDVDGDGVPDIVAATGKSQVTSNTSAFRIYSGATGAVLGSSSLTYSTCCSSGLSFVTRAGDLDGDGLAEEFMMIMQPDPYTLQSSIRIFRGLQQLVEFHDIDPGATNRYVLNGALTPDLNGDGAQEFMTMTWSPANVVRVQWQTMLSPPPQNYCTGKLNSAGCIASIQTTGAISLTLGTGLTIQAFGAVNQKTGLFLWGRQPAAAPFLGGTLCVATPIRRGPAHSSGGSPAGTDCSGVLTFDVSAGFVDTEGLLLGAEIFGQFWHRDPSNPDGTRVALSDAVRALVCY